MAKRNYGFSSLRADELEEIESKNNIYPDSFLVLILPRLLLILA